MRRPTLLAGGGVAVTLMLLSVATAPAVAGDRFMGSSSSPREHLSNRD